MRVVVVDMGLSNIASVLTAGTAIGQPFSASADPADAAGADRLILPGVGNFGAAMAVLEDTGWAAALRSAVATRGVPLLGICLGMQLLADFGVEGGGAPGLGLVAGTVVPMEPGHSLRVPHVGWNELDGVPGCPLLDGIPNGTDFYFVHSYEFRAERAADVIATTPYGSPVAAIVGSGQAVGVQFHPEKSSKAGLRLLANFVERGAARAEDARDTDAAA